MSRPNHCPNCGEALEGEFAKEPAFIGAVLNGAARSTKLR